MAWLKIETPYRTFIMIFFLEAYLDLLLGGLLNTENDHFFISFDNWGINGNLTITD